MNELYEMKISGARWWVYDIPGNVGWIIWLICTAICLVRGITVFSLISLVPAIFMLIGVAELVSERIAKLDRILPKKRVLRGFGSLTLGGILGFIVSIFGMYTRVNCSLPVWMLVGAVLCGLFAGLCYKGYEKQTD